MGSDPRQRGRPHLHAALQQGGGHPCQGRAQRLSGLLRSSDQTLLRRRRPGAAQVRLSLPCLVSPCLVSPCLTTSYPVSSEQLGQSCSLKVPPRPKAVPPEENSFKFAYKLMKLFWTWCISIWTALKFFQVFPLLTKVDWLTHPIFLKHFGFINRYLLPLSLLRIFILVVLLRYFWTFKILQGSVILSSKWSEWMQLSHH